MQPEYNKSLKSYNSFGLDVRAKTFLSVGSEEELAQAISIFSEEKILILGGGSNILLTKDFDGMVLHVDLKGIKINPVDDNHVIVEAAAGENWHELVMYCLDKNLGGIENLSLIPGNVGTAPIQNIGAYGVELKDVFYDCRGFTLESGDFRTFTTAECQFGYRNSIFKEELKSKVVITSVRLKLSTKDHKIHTSYGAIKQALAAAGVKSPGIKDVSEAVVRIRQSKLPDPAKIGNSGSFFKNPVIGSDHFRRLKKLFPEIPSYTQDNGKIKVPAGWLIEKAGFKGKRFGDYGVHDKQALVLVNYGNAAGDDILKLAQLIQLTIKRIFDIKLEPEVNII